MNNEARMIKAFTEAIESLKARYVVALTKSLEYDFNKAVEATEGMTCKENYEWITGKGWTRGHSNFPTVTRELFAPKDTNGYYSPYAIAFPKDKAITDEIIGKEARHQADMFHTSFMKKNTAKLVGVLKDKQATTITVRVGDHLTGSMSVDCSDGSRFDMTFDIIYKISSKGNFFNQFPTRFTNVTKSDGSKMKTPSEAKMKREF